MLQTGDGATTDSCSPYPFTFGALKDNACLYPVLVPQQALSLVYDSCLLVSVCVCVRVRVCVCFLPRLYCVFAAAVASWQLIDPGFDLISAASYVSRLLHLLLLLLLLLSCPRSRSLRYAGQLPSVLFLCIVLCIGISIRKQDLAKLNSL